jgi:GNAT superfamily N-acetyltransferase
VDGLHIDPWREDDGVALDKVLEETDVLTGQFRPQQGLPAAAPFRITFVARDDSGPVGVATAFESRWHPQRLWVSVEVASSHRRRGVGSALLGAVRAASGGRPLRAKVFAGGAAAGFAAAHGFRVIQRSRTVRFDPPQVPTPGMSVEIDAAPEAVAAALLDIYVRTHAWDPPGDIDVDDVLAVHVADAAVTLMVRDAPGVALAAAGVYDEEDGLGLSGGATAAAGTLARPAVGAFLDAAAAYAASQGRPLFVEVDDANTELVAETAARHATPVDEVHIVVDDQPRNGMALASRLVDE